MIMIKKRRGKNIIDKRLKNADKRGEEIINDIDRRRKNDW